MSRRDENWELEDLDLEEESDYETKEEKPLKAGTMILVFLGLVVLAAVICAILWTVTHKDKENSQIAGTSAEVSRESEESSEVTEESSQVTEESPQVTEESSEDNLPTDSSGTGEETPDAPKPETEAEDTAESSESVTVSESVAEETDDANRVSTKDGRVIVFTDCDDIVTPKEYVNMRLEPSTSEGNATIHCVLNYGETVHRTGISVDSGWSRVEKDDVVCYVVSSYVYVVEE